MCPSVKRTVQTSTVCKRHAPRLTQPQNCKLCNTETDMSHIWTRPPVLACHFLTLFQRCLNSWKPSFPVLSLWSSIKVHLDSNLDKQLHHLVGMLYLPTLCFYEISSCMSYGTDGQESGSQQNFFSHLFTNFLLAICEKYHIIII